MKSTIYLIFFIFIFANTAMAQKEANIWYFGKNAGIDFATGKPVADTTGKLSTEEGCVTICDKNGKLLFYTDGISVWDANHQLLPNGTGLKGHPSSTQSGVVIPKPNTPGMYYLFTLTGSGDTDGLRYSLININLNNNKGDIDTTKKNILLHTPATEKLTAVKHRNNKDIWVIAHEWKSNAFLSYLVSEKGINTTPVVSKTGSTHDGGKVNSQGYMKANPDGTNIAVAIEDSNKFELFDFDNLTGVVTNPITFNLPVGSYPYGIEFSPDGSVLYGSAAGTGEVYQYNLQAGSVEAIKKSATIVGKTENKKWIGALQIAVDGKIYFPIYGTSYLGVINKPNVVGIECGYANNAIFLNNKIAQLGLPTFMQHYFHQNVKTENVTYFDEKKVEIGKSLILNNIVFEYNKYNLLPTSFVELEKVIGILKQNTDLKIALAGHTDNIGNKSYNIELSKNRAKSVRDYLISKGITESRITYQGFGSISPIVDNSTESGRAKNRRVELVLTK